MLRAQSPIPRISTGSKKMLDEFIELRYYSYNQKEVELMGKEVSEAERLKHKITIRRSEVESFEEAIPATLEYSKDNLVNTFLTTKTGNQFLVDMRYADFKNLFFNERC